MPKRKVGDLVSVMEPFLSYDMMEEHGYLWVCVELDAADSGKDALHLYKSIATDMTHHWYDNELESFDAKSG